MHLQKIIQTLMDKDEVQFDADNLHYDIYLTAEGDGYMVDVFTSTGEEPIDGGLCTGTAEEAIQFMLPKEL